MRLLRREICWRGEFRMACASTSRAGYRRLQSSTRRVTSLGLSGLGNGGSKPNLTGGGEGVDVGGSGELGGIDGGISPKARGKYFNARFFRLFLEMSKKFKFYP